MNKLTLILLFSFAILITITNGNELSVAEVPNKEQRDQVDLGICGDHCQALFDTGRQTLMITATDGQKATMNDYDWSGLEAEIGEERNLPVWMTSKKLDGRPILRVAVQKGITYIGRNAFRDMVDIVNVTVDASVKTIAESAFSGCTGLSDLDLNKDGKLETIGDLAFYHTGLVSITLPNTLREIGSSAFSNCENLRCVSIGGDNSALDTLGGYAFYSCERLYTVAFHGEKDVSTLDNKALPFSGANQLEKIRVKKTYDKDRETFAGVKITRTNDLACQTPAGEMFESFKINFEKCIKTTTKGVGFVTGVIGCCVSIINFVLLIVKVSYDCCN